MAKVPTAADDQPVEPADQAEVEALCMQWLEAILAAPEDPEPLCGLALALQDLGEYAQALPLWQQAEQLGPATVEMLMAQGKCLEQLGLDQEAIALAERACAAHPSRAEPFRLLGFMHWRGGQFAQAEGPWRQALELEPDNPLNLINFGGVLNGLNRLEEAIKLHRQAVQLAPEAMISRINLAISQRRLGDFNSAEATLNEALRLEPDDPQLRWCQALTRLLRGDYAAAWPDFEQRFSIPDPSQLVADPGPRRWPGPSAGRPASLLLMGEQGLGDMIQFSRYVPLMRRFSDRVELCVPASLQTLLAEAELADTVITPEQLGERPHQDWMPLLSTPGVLGVSQADPLVIEPHLRIDPERRNRWRERLPDGPERLIAINWQGNPATEALEGFRGRSMPLEALAPLAAVPGIQLVSLQKGSGAEQRQPCSFRDRFVEIQSEIDSQLDFAEMAAVMAGCDLVISTDTAVAHLAGSLGLPAWLVLKWAPDWRWGFEGDRSHWYPSMRLFRQSVAGSWREPLERLVADLVIWLGSQGPRRPDPSA
ncbi:MAG: tetratricopeptide repeat-containing glycosyltransferase family protein [Cyanobium sp.]